MEPLSGLLPYLRALSDSNLATHPGPRGDGAAALAAEPRAFVVASAALRLGVGGSSCAAGVQGAPAAVPYGVPRPLPVPVPVQLWSPGDAAVLEPLRCRASCRFLGVRVVCTERAALQGRTLLLCSEAQRREPGGSAAQPVQLRGAGPAEGQMMLSPGGLQPRPAAPPAASASTPWRGDAAGSGGAQGRSSLGAQQRPPHLPLQSPQGLRPPNEFGLGPPEVAGGHQNLPPPDSHFGAGWTAAGRTPGGPLRESNGGLQQQQPHRGAAPHGGTTTSWAGPTSCGGGAPGRGQPQQQPQGGLRQQSGSAGPNSLQQMPSGAGLEPPRRQQW